MAGPARKNKEDQERASAEVAGIPRWLARLAALSWRIVVVAAAFWVIGQALIRLRFIVIPVVIALFAATLLAPPADWLKRRGLPPLAATWIVFLVSFGFVVGVGWFIGPQIAEQTDEFRATLGDAFANVRSWIVGLGVSEQTIDDTVQRLQSELRGNAGTLVRGVLSGALMVLEIVAGILLSIVITFFFVKDGQGITDWFLGLFSKDRARDLHEIGTRVSSTIGGYFRGTAIVGVVNAVLIGSALAILGVPLVIPLALLTFLGAFFPFIGAFVAGLLAALIAWVTNGWVDAVIISAVTVVVQQVEGDVLAPLVLGRNLKLHPVVVMVSLAGGAILGGIFGAFLAVPLVASFASAMDYLRKRGSYVKAVDGGLALEQS